MITLAPWWWLLGIFAILPWVGPWRGRDVIQNLLRSLLFLTLAAALAKPFIRRDDATSHAVLILDQSSSVDNSARELALESAKTFASTHRASDCHLVLLRGSDAASQNQSPEMNEAFDSLTVLSHEGPEGSSPLSAACAHAASLIPASSHGSVTIVTDGLATRPNDARAVASLKHRKIPVHVVSLPTESRSATPVALHGIDSLRVGSTASLTATVVALGSDTNRAGTVQLVVNGTVAASAAYSGAGRETVPLSFEPSEAGFVEATLQVVTGNEGGNELPLLLPVQDPHRILYLGSLQQNGAQQLAKILGPGFQVTEVDPTNRSDFTAALAANELVILDDQPASAIPQEVEAAIAFAVTNEGLGLVMSGGKAAFGAGGWHNRTVESMLPIELVQKEEKRDPSTSLVIVIDTSGSMGGVRVQLAKEVARLAMRRLLPHDRVGIVEFYGAKRWAAPLQPASNAIELQRALNRMDAGGGTVILPALEEAYYALQNIDTRYKHVIVLTDGGVEAGDFESLMRRMSKSGINVSTVLTGGGYHSEFLVNVANWGKGRFYNVPNRFNLPEILLKQPSTSKLPTYRPGDHQVVARGGPGWWGDVETDSIPNLAGYVETKSRPGSTVLLETAKESHPVLTTWRYGLGRVTTFTTEPVGAGTQYWKDWSDYGKALARVLERSAADARDAFRFEVLHDGGESFLHAIRQRPRLGDESDTVPHAQVVGESSLASDSQTDRNSSTTSQASESEAVTLEFVAKSPDRFAARLPKIRTGNSLQLKAWSSDSPRVQPLVARSPVADEQHVDPQNGLNLTSLARATGGKLIEHGGEWSIPKSANGGAWLMPLSPWLFGIALILFLIEVVWRRRSQETMQPTEVR